MREYRLQHNFIMWFGQLWPEHNNMLFEVNNNPKNEIHGAYRKSMGMKKNVSDMVLFTPYGKYACIELKAPGSTWPKEHIENQINWGKQVIDRGGYYIMCSNFEFIKRAVIAFMENDITLSEWMQKRSLEDVTSQFTNKTIKF